MVNFVLGLVVGVLCCNLIGWLVLKHGSAALDALANVPEWEYGPYRQLHNVPRMREAIIALECEAEDLERRGYALLASDRKKSAALYRRRLRELGETL